MLSKSLLIVHQGSSNPGRMATELMARGHLLDIRCPAIGHVLPDRVDEYDFVASFGGPMSANDEHLPGMREELDWLPKVLAGGRPFLGICLGAQMLARVLGAEVWRHPEGRVEIGHTPIRPTPSGLALFGGPMHVYQWHSEGMDLPSGATALALGDAFPIQAYRHGGNAYGVQFHPDVTLDMKRRWSVFGAHRLDMPGARPARSHVEEHPVHEPAMIRFVDRFLDRVLIRPGLPVSGRSPPDG